MENSSLFHADGADIFQIIENAILVAAFDHPDELKRQRDTIVELCFKALLPRFPQGAKADETIKKDTEEIIKKAKKEEDRSIDVVEEIIRFMDILSGHHHQSQEERSVEEKVEMRRQETRQLPVSTGQELHHIVGRDQAIPVKLPNKEIKPRRVAEPEPGRLPKLVSRPRQLPLQRKPPSIPQRQSECDEEAYSVQAKLEVAKRKLHEGYQRADNAKKQRTIKVIEQRDMPKKKGRRTLRPIQKLKNEIREWARAHSVKPLQKQ